MNRWGGGAERERDREGERERERSDAVSSCRYFMTKNRMLRFCGTTTTTTTILAALSQNGMD